MQKESEGPTTSLRQLLTTSDSAKTTRKQMLAVLLSVDDAMIHACITRQVARHAHMRSHPTKHELKENMELAANIPGQYISIICDKIGLPMTNRQCAQVVDDIALYLRGGPDSDKIAVAIDMVQTTQSWPITRTHEGLRKYTDFTKVTVYNTCEKDLAHRSIVDRFLTDLRPQIQDGPDYDKPRPVPFVEVGFSDQIYLRLQQHSSHTNSNYLMNLFHAAVENRFGGIFKLHQEVLSLCSEPADAWLGEIAFTQLCKGYVTEASGFSHSGAGLSIGNFYERLPAEIWDTMYLHGARTEKIERNLQKEEEIARVRHFAEPGAHQRFEDEILKDIESVEQISRTLQSLEELRQIDQEIKELLEST
ncbi:hypothetical protein A1O3_00128 [Capronia epimyces CBS 606.96]|uniref:Uncharacterized protein n=1 Tax=Capronia epimyces CBS 606.96 TaxID=1182542 RepID=W9YPI3_9EURO|nr:uncharacterized protein A1O3_00128 [Capronia epimyces CBS 606.96]EXJ91580.1 hypothetical protein A1O3_00128 [Capronia epimyces CBS 606.96]